MATRRVTRQWTREAENASPIANVMQRRLAARGTARTVEQVRVAVAASAPTDSVVPTPAYESGPLMDILGTARRTLRRPRGDAFLHVSDLLYKCQRKVAIVELHNIPKRGDSLSLTEDLTFAQGEAIHSVIKARAVLAAPQSVWGNWRCGCGTLKVEEPCTLPPRDAVCNNCGGPAHTYEEVPMFDEDLYLVGTPDLLLWKAAVAAYQITELKSMAHDNWKELVRPDPDHVLQALFYWYLMRRLGYPLTDTVSILYATKSMVFRGPCVKEFVIKVEPELHRLEPYVAEARALKAARVGGPLPPRKCVSSTASDAKQCEVCQICFAI